MQEIHCDLKCVLEVCSNVLKCVQVSSSVFISVYKLLLVYLYFVSFNAKYLYVFMLFYLQFYFIFHTLFGIIRKNSLSLICLNSQPHPPLKTRNVQRYWYINLLLLRPPIPNPRWLDDSKSNGKYFFNTFLSRILIPSISISIWV